MYLKLYVWFVERRDYIHAYMSMIVHVYIHVRETVETHKSTKANISHQIFSLRLTQNHTYICKISTFDCARKHAYTHQQAARHPSHHLHTHTHAHIHTYMQTHTNRLRVIRITIQHASTYSHRSITNTRTRIRTSHHPSPRRPTPQAASRIRRK